MIIHSYLQGVNKESYRQLGFFPSQKILSFPIESSNELMKLVDKLAIVML